MKPREHGTRRGYHQHLAHAEVPCWPCNAANNRYHGRQSRRGRCAKGLGWPLELPAEVIGG